jgi:hypothetical protein
LTPAERLLEEQRDMHAALSPAMYSIILELYSITVWNWNEDVGQAHPIPTSDTPVTDGVTHAQVAFLRAALTPAVRARRRAHAMRAALTPAVLAKPSGTGMRTWVERTRCQHRTLTVTDGVTNAQVAFPACNVDTCSASALCGTRLSELLGSTAQLLMRTELLTPAMLTSSEAPVYFSFSF